jgi:hypothetical protein
VRGIRMHDPCGERDRLPEGRELQIDTKHRRGALASCTADADNRRRRRCKQGGGKDVPCVSQQASKNATKAISLWAPVGTPTWTAGALAPSTLEAPPRSSAIV